MESLLSRFLTTVLAAFLGLTLGTRLASAQTAATLTGTIADASGGALPGVQLSLRNAGTGLIRTATSGTDGRFVFAGIPAGTYELRAELSGFRTVVRQGLAVSVAQSLSVPLVMEVGGLEQTVTVSGGAAAVNTDTSELSFLVGEQAIETLPLNGRNFTDLALLQPGVLPYPSRDGGSVVAHGLGMSVNGQDYRSNVYLLDGTLLNDFTNGPAGSAAGTALGMEAVREFRVQSNAYSAEFGRNYGGQINVLTKSGTNTLRGSAFEFHRNDALDAPNYFDVAGKPDFSRNQYGASLGGPLQQNRLFYFAAYEGLRERLGKTISSFVPDADARRGILPDGPVSISDVIRPYLAAIPEPTGAAIGSGLAPHAFGFQQKLDQTFLQGRADYQAGAAHQFFVRHTYDDGEQRLPTDYPAFPRSFISSNQFFTAEYRNVHSQRTLQTARFGYSRTRIGQNVEANLASPLPPFVAGRGLVGDIDIGGMQRFGPQTSANLRLAQNVYSGQYDVTHTRGRHLFKAGGLVERYRDFMTNPTFSLGIYAFANLRAFLENRPLRFVGLPPEGDIDRDWPWTMVGVYAQDTISLSRRLTLNAGLRYELQTPLADNNKILTNLDFINGKPFAYVGGQNGYPQGLAFADKNNLAPRVGLAWAPGEGRTVARAGYGLFYSYSDMNLWCNQVHNVPLVFPEIRVSNALTPTVQGFGFNPPMLGQTLVAFTALDPRAKTPLMQQASASFERQLRDNLMVQFGYLGAWGRNFDRSRLVNNAQPAPGGVQPRRPFQTISFVPNTELPPDTPILSTTFPVGPINLLENTGKSEYNSAWALFKRTFSGGLSFLSSYTVAYSYNDAPAFRSPSMESEVPQDSFHPEKEWGPNGCDVRHRFVSSVLYHVPYRASTSSIARAIFGDWQIAFIYQAQSGFPFTIGVFGDTANAGTLLNVNPIRADVVPGVDPNLPSGERNPDHWFNTAAFATPAAFAFGTATRNSMVGPALAKADLAFERRFDVHASRLDFRVEIFNVFNRENYMAPERFVNTPQFGTITMASTPARQVQFAARVNF